MTKEEAYDRCVAAWGDRAAVYVFGDVYAVGTWVAIGEVTKVERTEDKRLRFVVGPRGKTPTIGVETRGEGASWEEALTRAGVYGEIVK